MRWWLWVDKVWFGVMWAGQRWGLVHVRANEVVAVGA